MGHLKLQGPSRALYEGLLMGVLIWKPQQLCSIFDIDWETSQLKSVIKELDIPQSCSIAGGALVRTLLGQDIFKGDIDIFPHTDTARKAAEDKYSGRTGWEFVKHAYSFEFSSGLKKTKAQVIICDGPKAIPDTLDTFDFEHCKFSYVPNVDGTRIKHIKPGSEVILTTMCAPICLAKKEVRLANIIDPNYSLGRAIKYKRMGFNADKAIEYLATMAMKGMKGVKLCDDEDFSTPYPLSELEAIVSSASS